MKTSSVISRSVARPHSHVDCDNGRHVLLCHPDIEITCEEWDQFLVWQRNWGRFHGPLPEGEYVDLPRYLAHAHCDCRTTKEII